MRIEPYLLDDRVIIPDSINNMSKEQIEREIARQYAAYCRKRLPYERRVG